MAAVIGLTPDEVLRVIEKYELKDIDVANYITPLQSVVAGRKEAIDSAGKYFEQAGAKAYLLLNVSGAFHSRYMKQASVKFENYVHKHSFKKITIPVISNINARPHKDEDVKKNLIRQLTSSVCWNDSILYLMDRHEKDFEEIGPGNVLTNMLKQIKTWRQMK